MHASGMSADGRHLTAAMQSNWHASLFLLPESSGHWGSEKWLPQSHRESPEWVRSWSPLHNTAASWRAQARIINIWSLWPELTPPPKMILTLRLRDKNICRYPFLPPTKNGQYIKRRQWSTYLEPWKHPERKLWGPRENAWPRGRIPVFKL